VTEVAHELLNDTEVADVMTAEIATTMTGGMKEETRGGEIGVMIEEAKDERDKTRGMSGVGTSLDAKKDPLDLTRRPRMRTSPSQVSCKHFTI
jgi:hypothetical protein